MKTLWLGIFALGLLAANAAAVDCRNLPDWENSAVYVGDDRVRHLNNAYTAKWWTQAQDPATHSGTWDVWRYDGACDGSPSGSSSSGSSSSSASSSSSSSSGSSGGGSCSSPQYAAGIGYSAGDLVQNGGLEFRCEVAGWCSQGGAYEPGVGWAWTDAWTQVGDCSGGGGSSSSSSSSGGSSSSSSGGNSGLLPAHALVGYWHNFDNGSGLYRIAEVSDVWDVIVVAFADDAGSGNVAFNPAPGLDKRQFIADIAAKRAAGKIVVVSFGGQNGTVTLNTAEQVANFVDSTAAMLDEYGFDGIDIDLESGAGVIHGAPVIRNLVEAVRQLKGRYPDMYLSMAPEHPYVQGGYVAYSGIWGAYLPIIDQLRDELDLLHVQLYNNGGLSTPYHSQPYPAGSVDMMVASALMLIEGFPLGGGSAGFFEGLAPEQVALGLPSGPSSAGSGQAATADINRALDCLTARINCATLIPGRAYPDFNGVMTWSINWDMHDGGIFSGPVGSHVHNLP